MKTLNGNQFRKMLDAGLASLKQNVDLVNRLNVFPVPDADTGTNMVKTLDECFKTIDTVSKMTVASVADCISKTITLNARGNSGTILSQFFKGLSETLTDKEEIDSVSLAQSLRNGVNKAYSSVPNPVEGTMLTVLRVATDKVEQQADTLSVDDSIALFSQSAKEALSQTKEQLQELKDANVIDSGGAGVCYFFDGAHAYLSGKKIAAADVSDTSDDTAAETVDYTQFHCDTKFDLGFCVELLLQLRRLPDEELIRRFKEGVNLLGSSVVTAVENDKIVVHVHTMFPEKILSYAHEFGEMLSIHIDNLSVQYYTHLNTKIVAAENADAQRFAVVVCVRNEEEKELVLSLGADYAIVENADVTEDLYRALLQRSRSERFLIFATCEGVRFDRLFPQRSIEFIRCENFAQCYTALCSLQFESADFASVAAAARKAIGRVKLISVTDDCVQKVSDAAAEALSENPNSIMTWFVYGDVDLASYEQLAERIKNNYPFAEMTILHFDSATPSADILFE